VTIAIRLMSIWFRWQLPRLSATDDSAGAHDTG